MERWFISYGGLADRRTLSNMQIRAAEASSSAHTRVASLVRGA